MSDNLFVVKLDLFLEGFRGSRTSLPLTVQFQNYTSRWAPRPLRRSNEHNVDRDVSCFGVGHRSSRIVSPTRTRFVFVFVCVPACKVEVRDTYPRTSLHEAPTNVRCRGHRSPLECAKLMDQEVKLAMQPRANSISLDPKTRICFAFAMLLENPR